MDYINIVDKEIIKNSIACIDNDYMLNIESIPRSRVWPPDNLNDIKWRKVWLFRKSNFKDWRIETKDFINDCFDFDWQFCKIPKVIKDVA